MNGNVFNETDEKYDELLIEMKKLLKFLINFFHLGNAEVNVILISLDKIKIINKKYKNVDKETDVISFALEESDDKVISDFRVLGDIFISPEVAFGQASKFDNSLNGEIEFLLVHGFLHLLGYDHMNDEDTKKMFSRQEMLIDEYRKQ